MTVLSLPRIILNGSTMWNPATNNNGLANGYNKDPVSVKLPQGVTYDTFDDWLIAFRNGATNGSWNVFGQMQTTFDAKVVGVRTSRAAAADPIVGAALSFSGGTPKLVDVNPYSSVSSQVFIGGFGLEAAAGIGFSGNAVGRMSSRRPFMARNTAGLPIAGNMGVVWQTTIAKDGINWGNDYAQSPVLAELHAAMRRSDVQGIMLRIASYTTIYFTGIVEGGVTTPGNGTPAMAAAFQKLADRWASLQPITAANVGQAFNPAKSSLTGVIGLWEKGELATVPCERVLAMESGALGPAQAKANEARGLVSLDLMNTFPESGAGSAKVDSGTYELAARAADGTLTTIGTLAPDDYGKAAYDQGGGIFDIEYAGDWSAVTTGRLELIAANGPGKMGGPSPTPAIAELVLHADTDDRSIYLDEGDEAKVTVRVFERGGAPTRPTKLMVAAYYPPEEGPLEGVWQLVPPAGDAKTFPRNVALGGGTAHPGGILVDAAADGSASFSVSPLAEGNAFVTFTPFDTDAPPAPPPTITITDVATTGYVAIRVMPFDAALNKISQDQITWSFVYDNVLRPFDLVYRGMSPGIFSFHSEAKVKANAAAIIALTDPDRFESPGYMPVTRDLSLGRRTLLVRFLKAETVPIA